MAKVTLRDLKLRDQRVLVRVDFNVPLEDSEGKRVITDDTRIRETIATIDYLHSQGAKVILMSHLGRPKGKRNPAESLRPVAERLSELLVRPVAFVDDCIGDKVEKTAGLLKAGDTLLLENVRFYPEEEKTTPTLQKNWPG
jgi:phosphoglycerate kinase